MKSKTHIFQVTVTTKRAITREAAFSALDSAIIGDTEVPLLILADVLAGGNGDDVELAVAP